MYSVGINRTRRAFVFRYPYVHEVGRYEPNRTRWGVRSGGRGSGGVTGRARVCGHGLKHDVWCGHTAWLVACTASSNAARAIFGDHTKPSTAERMVPSVGDGESA